MKCRDPRSNLSAFPIRESSGGVVKVITRSGRATRQAAPETGQKERTVGEHAAERASHEARSAHPVHVNGRRVRKIGKSVAFPFGTDRVDFMAARLETPREIRKELAGRG